MEGLGGKGLVSPIQQTILEGLEKGEFGLEDVEGLEAFPVQVHMDAQLNPQRIWKPVPLSALKQIKQATADYGIHSHYTKALLEALGLGNLMIPADWKALFKMLLTPSQYVVFDFHYKQQALARGTAQIIPDQIYGSGQFTAVDQQKDLPDEAYPIIILAVFVALSKVEGKEGGKSFANIKQQNGENYGTFIDRLKLAIERQINNPQAQEELLLKLAVENANVDCKRLLTPLVASGSALDLAQLLEAAAKAARNRGSHLVDLVHLDLSALYCLHPLPVAAQYAAPINSCHRIMYQNKISSP
ncbi:hypothetical protein E2320_008018 [Naja naja]|nr:hypothetical protein E2320_008018 [Naja naja]